MKKFINLLMLLLASFNTLAASNSNPGLYYGQVPTAAQWNSYFSSKLDYSPGAANTLPYWDGSGNLLAAPVTGGCSFAAGVFTCSPINLAGGTVGAIPYQSAPDTTLFLSGNTTTTPQFVTSTGTGAAAQAPTLTGSTGSGNVVLASALNSYAVLAGSTSQTFSVAPATTGTMAVRADQITTDPAVYPTYTKPTVWTPVQAGVSLTVTYARYIKLGALYYVQFDITWPVTADGTAIAISGIPGTVAGGSACTIGYTTATAFTLNFGTGSSSIYAYTFGGVALTNADLSGKRVIASGWYSI